MTWRAISAWPDPSALCEALGVVVVRQRAAEGDREAQFSLGYVLVDEADEDAGATHLGASGRSPKADVGLALCTAQFPVAHQTEMRCGWSLADDQFCFVCGCQPWAEEGVALLEKAAGQGHAYAMFHLGCIHLERQEYEHAVEWFTKGAEAGLPKAMFDLGWMLSKGEGVAAPDYPAAADWYRRAADAGDSQAAYNLAAMYQVGRGGAWQIMPASSSFTF